MLNKLPVYGKNSRKKVQIQKSLDKFLNNMDKHIIARSGSNIIKNNFRNKELHKK